MRNPGAQHLLGVELGPTALPIKPLGTAALFLSGHSRPAARAVHLGQPGDVHRDGRSLAAALRLQAS